MWAETNHISGISHNKKNVSIVPALNYHMTDRMSFNIFIALLLVVAALPHCSFA